MFLRGSGVKLGELLRGGFLWLCWSAVSLTSSSDTMCHGCQTCCGMSNQREESTEGKETCTLERESRNSVNSELHSTVLHHRAFKLGPGWCPTCCKNCTQVRLNMRLWFADKVPSRRTLKRRNGPKRKQRILLCHQSLLCTGRLTLL